MVEDRLLGPPPDLTPMETTLKAYDNMPNVQSQMLTSQLGLPRRHGRILVRLRIMSQDVV